MDQGRHSNWYCDETLQTTTHDNCPRCHTPEEPLVHILTCPNNDVRTLTNDLLMELEIWMTREDTSLIPILVASVRSVLLDQYGDEPLFQWSSTTTGEATIARQNLGWYALLMGCILNRIVSL